MSMILRGGDTIWGSLDWSPEEGYSCDQKREMKNSTRVTNRAHAKSAISLIGSANYGRIASFGKDVAGAPPNDIDRIDFKVRTYITRSSESCPSLLEFVLVILVLHGKEWRCSP